MLVSRSQWKKIIILNSSRDVEAPDASVRLQQNSKEFWIVHTLRCYLNKGDCGQHHLSLSLVSTMCISMVPHPTADLQTKRGLFLITLEAQYPGSGRRGPGWLLQGWNEMEGMRVTAICHTSEGWKERQKTVQSPQFSLKYTSSDLKTFSRPHHSTAPRHSTTLGTKSFLWAFGGHSPLKPWATIV